MTASNLYPTFQKLLDQLVANCASRGATYVQTAGLRTFAEQDKLYAQGRTAPGNVVTKAAGGSSAHNFGVAADYAAKVAGKISWKETDYQVLKEEAGKLGLESGGTWKFKDLPHVQLPLLQHALTFSILKTEYLAGGLPAVFKLLDKYKWGKQC